MTYQETVNYLFNQLPVFQSIGAGAYKPGLTTAYTLSAAFGNPHLEFSSIHVAGTNGKGSTSHMLASILAESGMKVGLFTSPHIFDFRERIRVNGEKIPKEYVVDFVDRYLKMDLPCSPSFFELTTIMAFEYFKSQKVDVAVIEVGLGGKLDTTNIITPLVSVITNVSLDHMLLLGDTEPKIAGEKAGIIKPGVPVVVGESDGEVREVFRRRAEELGSPIVFADDTPYQYRLTDGKYQFRMNSDEDPWIDCELTGSFQTKNINTVLHVLPILDIYDKESIFKGLSNVTKNTSLIGRWMEVEYRGRKLICDTGHNIGAWKYIAAQLTDIAYTSQLHVVVGFSNDKDIAPIFSLLPKNASYYFVKPSVHRGRPVEDLLSMAQDNGLTALGYKSVTEGVESAIVASGAEDIIFVGGSNFVIADLKL